MDIPSVTSQNAALQLTGTATIPAPEAEDRRQIIQAVHAVNAAEFYGPEHELAFAVDRESRRAVVRIVDRKTRAIVDQIPSEQVLRLAEELKQQD